MDAVCLRGGRAHFSDSLFVSRRVIVWKPLVLCVTAIKSTPYWLILPILPGWLALTITYFLLVKININSFLALGRGTEVGRCVGLGIFALAQCLLCSRSSHGHWGGWARTWLSNAGCSGVPWPLPCFWRMGRRLQGGFSPCLRGWVKVPASFLDGRVCRSFSNLVFSEVFSNFCI